MIKLTIKKQHLRILLSASIGLTLSTCLLAADEGSIGGTGASVTSLAESTPMSFGSIFATGNNNTAGDVAGSGSINGVAQPGHSAYLDLALDGTLTSTNGRTAVLSELGVSGTAAVFDVTAAANSQVRFSSPLIKDADSTATTIAVTDGTRSFIFTDLIMDTNGSGTSNNDIIGDTFSGTVLGTTDGGGLLSVSAAGRLYTDYIDTTDNAIYTAGGYTITYPLIVSY